MTSYTETLAVLAASTETDVVALHDRWDTGEITEAQFVALATVALVHAAARGTALADLALAAALSVQRHEPVPTLGLDPPADATRTAETAVRDTLASAAYLAGAASAVAVLGRSHTLAVAQDAYAQGMRRQGVQTWTRVLNGGACELCHDLAGDVLPVSADMYHHRGCGCTQQPL